jgi:hypothetical protein
MEYLVTIEPERVLRSLPPADRLTVETVPPTRHPGDPAARS